MILVVKAMVIDGNGGGGSSDGGSGDSGSCSHGSFGIGVLFRF